MDNQDSLFSEDETPMAKKTRKTKAKPQKELSGTQDLYNYLYKACNKLRGPVSQDYFKEYISPLLYYKRISVLYDNEAKKHPSSVVEVDNGVVNNFRQFKDAFRSITVHREIKKKRRGLRLKSKTMKSLERPTPTLNNTTNLTFACKC